MRHLGSKPRTLTRLSYSPSGADYGTRTRTSCRDRAVLYVKLSQRGCGSRTRTCRVMINSHPPSPGGPHRIGGERLLPAAHRMSFTRRLLDENPGCRLHADAPSLCTNALVCETRTPALSVISHDSRRIALPLSPRDEDSGDRTCLVQSARPLFHTFGAGASAHSRV